MGLQALYSTPADGSPLWHLLSRIVLSISLVLAICVFYLLFEDWKVKRKYRFPPIVPGLPLIGNTFQFPLKDQGPYLRKVAENHGEMMTFKFGRTYWVVLNSRRTTLELLEKRAAIYSSRQNLTMAHELVSGSKRILLMPYGAEWRKQRKMMHRLLSVTQTASFRPYQDLESRAMLYQLLDRPEKWYLSLGRFSNSIIMSHIFGTRTDFDDPGLNAIFKTQEEFVPYMMPGYSIVDTFPFLAKIPVLTQLQPWRRHADYLYKRTLRVFLGLIEEMEGRIERGTQKDCFMTRLLSSDEEFTRDEIAFIAGTLIEAGTDTTRGSMQSLIAGTALYPGWVKKAREELDAVCGQAERLPTFEDYDKLPMIKAAVKETVRWRPTNSQTGIPHALIQDDEFEGYRFPAGTVFTWNNWGISWSDKEFENAAEFKPERFLNEDLDAVAKGHLGFGAGRRLCVGYNVAASNLFIAVSRLIYCYDIEQDPAHPLVMDRPFPLDASVEPCKVIIKVRSEAHRQLILNECQEAAVIK